MEEARAHGDLEATDQNLDQNFPSADPRWDLNLPELEVAEMDIIWCKLNTMNWSKVCEGKQDRSATFME